MKNIVDNAPEVSDAFFHLAAKVTDYAAFDEKTKELVLLGVFTGNGGVRGIRTHTERAYQAGAVKKDIVGAILLALPVVGISNVTLSLEMALQTLKECENDENN